MQWSHFVVVAVFVVIFVVVHLVVWLVLFCMLYSQNSIHFFRCYICLYICVCIFAAIISHQTNWKTFRLNVITHNAIYILDVMLLLYPIDIEQTWEILKLQCARQFSLNLFSPVLVLRYGFSQYSNITAARAASVDEIEKIFCTFGY